MAKHMITPAGDLIKVSKTESVRLFVTGQASYMSKDEYARALEFRATRGKPETVMSSDYPCPPISARNR